MVHLVIAAALAAGPENGSFESGLAPWVDESTQIGASAVVVDEGTDFGDYSDTSGLGFPDGTKAVALKGGEGGIFTPAALGSAPFVVTWDELELRHRSEHPDVSHEARLRSGAQIVLSHPFAPDVNGSFDLEAIDVAGQCGAQVTIQVVQYSTVQFTHYFTAFDAFGVAGSPCPDYEDLDGDGFCRHGDDLDGDALCDGPLEAMPASSPVRDCDDDDAGRFPGNTEIEGDGIDQDCDGFDPTDDCYEDLDGDGFGGQLVSGSLLCDQPGETDIPGDCDDTEADVFPGATEAAADGIDQDCDGAELCYADLDGDGFGGGTVPGSLACDQPGEATSSTDCDDTRAATFPGAPELCNGIDDDCDGSVDPDPAQNAWPDADGDGHGESGSSPITVCGTVSGVAADDTDCNDDDAAVFPGAVEIPDDGVDQDCDGMELCYEDADSDGFGGDPVLAGVGCAGFPSNDEDCDDDDPTVNPGRPEVCDGVDNDCNGVIDDGPQALQWFPDTDGDGFGDAAAGLFACSDPGGDYILVGQDCDDTDAGVNPDADEIVGDAVDQDCDGNERCYEDRDGDGYGGVGVQLSTDIDCSDAGESQTDDDCNDDNADISPGAVEIPGNGRDEDCDGLDGALDTGDTAAIDPQGFVYRGGSQCSAVGAPGWAGLIALVLVAGRRRP